jgi:predicted transcriptional regulator
LGNRCRHDIVAAILREAVLQPSRLSHLALNSNVAYDRARLIVDDLVEHGLLVYDPYTRTYSPTELAYQWLAIYRELQNIYDRAGA